MDKNAISIKWSDEDNGFIATIPGINALSAFGSTQEQALSELNTAAEAYFEALKEAGKPLPVPEKVIPYSGQLRLRMPKSLHASLSSGAEREGLSLNTYIISLLSERHMFRHIMNKIDGLADNFKALYSEKTSEKDRVHISTQSAHRIEENPKKYKE
jgi:predicted HicB family RNase H-like nuclease